MSDAQKLYRFKWKNYDLEKYIESRMEVSKNLRRDAVTLCQRADQIENETRELQSCLIENGSDNDRDN